MFQKTKSFTRVVDGLFFPNEPLDLLAQKSFHLVPSIIGVNNHECGFLLPMVRIPLCLLPLLQQSGSCLLHTGHAHGSHQHYEGWSPSPEIHSSHFFSLKEENCGLGAAVVSVHSVLPIGLKEQRYKKVIDPSELCSKYYK